jgi:hypothetical protein
MTTRLAAAFAAVALTVGILVGAAGTILVRDVAHPAMDMADMAAMHSMMTSIDGSMMDGSMGTGSSMDPAQHEAHHGGSAR